MHNNESFDKNFLNTNKKEEMNSFEDVFLSSMPLSSSLSAHLYSTRTCDVCNHAPATLRYELEPHKYLDLCSHCYVIVKMDLFFDVFLDLLEDLRNVVEEFKK